MARIARQVIKPCTVSLGIDVEEGPPDGIPGLDGKSRKHN
jgi:hypothetical protein